MRYVILFEKMCDNICFMIISYHYLISDWFRPTFAAMLTMMLEWFSKPPSKILSDQQIKRLKAGLTT